MMELTGLVEGYEGAAFFLLIALIALLGLLFAQAIRLPGRQQQRQPWRRYKTTKLAAVAVPDLTDAGQQLNAVMAAPFKKRRVLSKSEYRAFKIVEDNLASLGGGYRVFAQTSLGQILSSPNKPAFRSINSKRVDILVVDWQGLPVLAVEFQGQGHYQGTAAARDAVKKEALRKAGVRYIEVFPSDSDEQIRSRVREQIDGNMAVPVNDRSSALASA